MSIWNKVFLGLIAVAGLVFFYTAARTLKTHQHWREKAIRFQQRLADTDKQLSELVAWNRATYNEIIKLVNDRGRVWYDCKPERADPQSREIAVKVEAPDPHGITNTLVLHVFEDEDVREGGRYLGQFQVQQINGPTVVLRATRLATANSWQRAAAGAGRSVWVLYEKMPFDSHEFFAQLTDEEKKNILPAETAAEYIKHGQEATWEQLEAEKLSGMIVDQSGVPLIDDRGQPITGAKGTYWRNLRDYQDLFYQFDIQRTLLADRLASVNTDAQMAAFAAANAKQDVVFYDQTINALKTESAKVGAERSALAEHFKRLSDTAAAISAGIDYLLAENKKMAAAIAAIQIRAARIIEEQTRAMAQSASGGN